MLSLLATLLLTTFIAVNAFTQSPYLSATQNFLDNVDRKTCIERAVAALAINNISVSTKGEELCFGSNQEFSVGIFCDWCGSVVNVNISVATNGNGASTGLLRDRILEYIATGSNTGGGTAGGEAVLWLDKNRFGPGEAVSVHFKAPGTYAADAWVGIIPSNVEHGSEAKNDQYDLTYQHLNKRTSGTLTFTAPAKAETYDFRMHDTDNNGKETAYVTFTVGTGTVTVAGNAALKLDKTVFAPGESITVHFIASASYPADAWVGIIPSNIEHGSEAKNDQYDLTYQYLNKRTTGSLTFAAPAQKGNFDLRMHDTDSNGKEVASVSFRVE